MRKVIEARRVGFTLIELLIVIAIIGLLVALILAASADGVRRAEERATQSLITKLETALNDRIDALLNTQAPINQTHRLLAAINYNIGGGYLPLTNNSDDRRAQVIAQFDYLRAELPDVFFVNSQTKDGGTIAGSGIAASYPLNFAAAPYPAGVTSPTPNNFVLPLGNTFPGLPLNSSGALSITLNPDGSQAIGTTGMFGASFSAAGGIYKNLGYGPQGYDGIDNDNNGLIDDFPEGGANPATVAALLSNHTHKTARSEMLYAILVNGLSPLGSVFSPEDFTSREVQDTDGDGLPEFIDAWGEPLQFFRWPIYYGSSQLTPVSARHVGLAVGLRYNTTSPSTTREEDPLDQNQLLVSPGWWSSLANPSMTPGQLSFSPPNGAFSPTSLSPGAIGFMNYFHSLVDPNTRIPGPATRRGGIAGASSRVGRILQQVPRPLRRTRQGTGRRPVRQGLFAAGRLLADHASTVGICSHSRTAGRWNRTPRC